MWSLFLLQQLDLTAQLAFILLDLSLSNHFC